MRVLFFGTPAFAVPTLERLLASNHDVVGVVTQPDRPRGRGQQLQPGPVKTVALQANLPVWQPPRLASPEALADPVARSADIGVVAAYGKILPAWLLALPSRGLINVHASLLPRWRGASPVHRAVVAGDDETGVTIMEVVQALDAGPMLDAAQVAIGPTETSAELETRLARLGADLLVDVLDRLERGVVISQPQDEQLVTYAPRLTRADGVIDWTRSARDLHNQIRGLHPWPMVPVSWRGRRLVLVRSTPLDAAAADAPPGTVLSANADGLVVSTGQGRLRIDELQLEGRPVMPAAAFLRGHAITAGDVLPPWPVG